MKVSLGNYKVYIVICAKVWGIPNHMSHEVRIVTEFNMEQYWLQILPLTSDNNQSALSLEINIPMTRADTSKIYNFIVFPSKYQLIGLTAEFNRFVICCTGLLTLHH